MKPLNYKLYSPCIIVLLASASLALADGVGKDQFDGMALVPSGQLQSFFKGESDPASIDVPAFLLDRFPVTNREFLGFVQANPRWRRSSVKRLFADENYLHHWSGDFDLGSAELDQPVVWISWFAAKAYASWKGKRLPSVAEWEYAAGASPTRPDGRNDAAFQNAQRHWLSTPTPKHLSRVGSGVPNYFGLHDLHGLVWEWTSDFNSATVTGDARGDTGLDRQLFCGAGSIGATNPDDFPAFMRYGFRSSLRANYTVHNLGFRCAQDWNGPKTKGSPRSGSKTND